ncbi:type II toxin-antitoxin system VapC family toxin [Patescibacteria group bacterium]|nr:type II toxin-antitoxin system VapC family toxin [Patescibacteria group bacterium]
MIGKGVVLDTSVLIDFLRQDDKAETWYFKLASMGGELLISILTHTELHAGKKIWENKRVKQELDDLLSDIKVLPVSQFISAKAGRIRAQTGVELVDAVIAATAIENKLSLATLNQKHFVRIKGLRLEKV